MSKSKPIVNEEHREAEQMEANRDRDAFIATLPKSEQAKFVAVEKAVRLLVKAKVPFYLFPQLESLQFKGKQQIWQWNSLVASVKFDKSGKPTEESNKENAFYHEAFFAFLFNQFKHLYSGATTEEKLSYMPYFYHYCLTKFSMYLEDAEKREESNES